ncbi:MAG: septum formation initiator family protein [Bacteroidia bacterium]|nr:septum formation initiator family protein [Bacteroidia bacterium]
MLDWLLYHLRNKYVIGSLVFFTWMLFFDRNDFISQVSLRSQLSGLEADKEYYLEEIENNLNDMNELMSNKENLEKFAREKYYMKKDDEEIFVIVTEKKKKKFFSLID